MSSAAREPGVSALLVGEYETDRILLRELFREFGWRLFEADNRHRALDCLTRNPVHVLITESHSPHWDWRKALNDLRRMARPPQLIVTSRTADDHLWAEVLNVGGYDVLAQPLERDEVERVLSSARRHFDLPVRMMSQGAGAPAASVA
jgi:response regulator RpfG family c-di-GMP phosphodiesterase